MSSSNDRPDISPDNLSRPPTPDDPPVLPIPSITPTLPQLPPTDLSIELESILGPTLSSQPPVSVDAIPQDYRHSLKMQKRANQVHKRQSNVLKLSEENDKLKEELRAMTERLEAAERRRQELERREKRQSCG